jgi:hypothetical protein
MATLVGNRLRTVSLGDCRLVVIRNEEVVFRTAESLHGWNFPFQLGESNGTRMVVCVWTDYSRGGTTMFSHKSSLTAVARTPMVVYP